MTKLISPHLDGIFTADDRSLFRYLRMLYETEEIEIEPSACAAFAGPASLRTIPEMTACRERNGLTDEALENAVQIVWATGGSMVPREVRRQYLNTL